MLSINDELTLVEIFSVVLGVAITWAIYHGSESAELPGEAREPDPSVAEDFPPARGRTL
jgi:hypothetical protein